MLQLHLGALVALAGLLVQALLAWMLVGALAVIGRHESAHGAYRGFVRAFLCLAVGLTVMSARFVLVYEPSTVEYFEDGDLAPRVSYVLYMALRAGFVIFVAIGCYRLAETRRPRWFRAASIVAPAVLGVLPLFVADINRLLLLLAPVMVVGPLVALHALRPLPRESSGLRIVRGALVALSASWVLHGVSVLSIDHWLIARLLVVNSLIDLLVQFPLGVGMIAVLLQETNRKLGEAERQREELRNTLARDEKLRALGTAVSGVAHELNNPLTVIHGHAELLRNTPHVGEAPQIIAEQAERCRGIVRSLSALAVQSVHPRETIELGELVQRVVRGLAPSLPSDGRTVRVGELGSIRLRADRIGLEQVLANVLTNALQAGPPGEPVDVDARYTNGGVEISVSDRGPGVPAELRERLFEPFFTTKMPGEGTGLGLSIAHAIVRGHRGHITIEDRAEGTGTVFRIALPQGSDETTVHEVPPRPASSEPGRVLLVIDDDKGVRGIVAAHARDRGWRVREEETVEQALRRPLRDVDAILCDLRMPGIGGAGLHDRFSRDGSPLLDRLVLFTGDLASPESADFALRSSRPLLTKPLDFDALFDALDRASRAPASA